VAGPGELLQPGLGKSRGEQVLRLTVPEELEGLERFCPEDAEKPPCFDPEERRRPLERILAGLGIPR